MRIVAEVSHRDGWVVLRARGELDLAGAPALRREILQVIADGAQRLIIDLDQVDLIDSTGLGVLIGAVRRLGLSGGELRLVCSVPRLLQVFAITLLDRILVIEPTLDAALAHVGTDQPS